MEVPDQVLVDLGRVPTCQAQPGDDRIGLDPLGPGDAPNRAPFDQLGDGVQDFLRRCPQSVEHRPFALDKGALACMAAIAPLFVAVDVHVALAD